MMMMALPRPLSNGWTACRLLLVSVINRGTLPEQDTQIMDNCKTQEVQMNRVLKTMVLFFILTGVSWQAVAFSEADLQKLKSSLKCPKCDLTGADLEGAVLPGADLTGADLTEANLFRANLAGRP